MHNTRARFFQAIIGLFLLLFFWVFFHNLQIIFYPYQAEYREGTTFLLTQSLLHHINPFKVASLPAEMTMYGILYNLAILPVIQLFNLAQNFMISHRAFTCILLLCSTALLFKINKRNGCRFSINMGLSLLFYGACFTEGVIFGTSIATPAPLGLLLMLLSTYLPLRYNFKFHSLLSSVILSVLCYYAKPYFIIGFLLVVSYSFLFVSKSKSILYGCLFILFFLSSAIIVQQIFPLYFVETFYTALSHYAVTPNQLSLITSPSDSTLSQLIFFAKHYSPIIITFFLVLNHLYKQNKSKSDIRDHFKTSLLNWSLSKGLLNRNLNFYLYSTITTLLIFYIEMGSNSGAWMEYLVQLTLPFMILFIGNYAKDLSYSQLKFSAILIAINIIWLLGISNKHDFTYGRTEWKHTEELLKPHTHIFASPAITSILLKQHKKIYLSGHSVIAFYIPDALKRNYPFVPKNARTEISSQLEQFQENTLRQIRERKFDLVIWDDQDLPFFNKIADELHKYYKLSEQYEVGMPIANQHWVFSVYLPQA